MATQVIQSPIWLGKQFQDSLGNLLAGGSVYSYVKNTTNEQTTYATVTESGSLLYGDSPNTNPILLNESGMMDTGFWLIASASYTFNVYDINGNFVTTENV